MNADKNPYKSPRSAEDHKPSAVPDDAKRRFRVGLMWGSSGVGYAALPWWADVVPRSLLPPEQVGFVLLGLVVGCAITASVGAVLLAMLGRPRDIVGAVCGLVFGAGLNGFLAGVPLLMYWYSGG